ncbi:hypothetical protein BJ912DRAFT_673829 [Pholiota molesta]|nr:hypothetical protein BJ912DRAFT_673829 [Pholiota molesta]
MHHCLRIYEILALICEASLYQKYQKYWGNNECVLDRPSLLALLKTCRSFSVPATKLLWRNLPGLVPLMFTMPKDLVEVKTVFGKVEELGGLRYSNCQVGPQRVRFRRPILPYDWERLDFYAPFVRHIEATMKQDPASTSLIVFHPWVCIKFLDRGKVFLPNLTMALSSSDPISLIPLLLTPRTHSFQLFMDSDCVFPLCCFADLDFPTRAPSLKSLDLSQATWPGWKPSDQPWFLSAVSKLLDTLDLEEFKCNCLHLTDQMMENLIKMPSLRKIDVHKNTAAVARALRLFPVSEPRLKEVSIKTDVLGPSYLAQILISLQPSLLEVFDISLIGPPEFCTQGQLNDLISAVGTHCSPRFLTHFSFNNTFQMEPPLAISVIVNSRLLRPLLPFSNLRRFYLGSYHFDYTDAEVKELAMSWPLLEALHIDGSTVMVPAPTKPRTTIRCLLWFAIYCRNLDALSFNFTGIDTFSDTELALASGGPLTMLSVGHSTITESDKAAAFISTVFTNIRLLIWSMSESSDAENQKMWREVDALLPDPGKL